MEARPARWVTVRPLAAPEAVDALPLRQYDEGVLAEEDAVGFGVDLLVGEQQAKRVDDERVPLVAAWHDAGVVKVLERILTANLVVECLLRLLDLVNPCLILRRHLGHQQLLVDLVANLADRQHLSLSLYY